MTTRYERYIAIMSSPQRFARLGGLTLRAYQQTVAQAIVHNVLLQRGSSFAVMFPRQSGKNELQAQIEAYLLMLLRHQPAEIVKISPTWKPQSLNAMRRLERVLTTHPFTRALWRKESGYIYRVGQARIFFLSGAPETNIVGATASTLLQVDEAQDVQIAKYDKEIAPMAASTNATRVFWGTAWTSRTLLARELAAAQAAQQLENREHPGPPANPHAFVLTADQVAAEVPAYGDFVAAQVARLGRQHPMIRTQYFSEEVDASGGLFTPQRLARMAPHAPASAVPANAPVAFLLDVAGGDESNPLAAAEMNPNPRRDATALTVVEIDASTCADPLLRAPTYRPIQRRQWTGLPHPELYGQIVALAERFRARWLVVDATGLGAGLAAFLARALPGRVIPFVFNQASKSKLGWDFLQLVDSGRWRELEPPVPLTACAAALPGGSQNADSDFLRALFFAQLAACQYEILPGPGRIMRWSVPESARHPAAGVLLHDDLLMSAALVTLLDDQPTAAPGVQPHIIPAPDPLSDMNGF